ncbi:Putative HTH-type transcriptional regulator [Propionicimonas sp. T2.31MG-18]|uniref:RrF2 family transcriptional regulator n=1 Tax=Propionicimonas sp. T2.31MG-18 TaxID=3157620 RepID=UPI0035EF8F91
MQVTARVDYAIRAMAEFAAQPDRALTRKDLAAAQDLPGKFLESILRDLARDGILTSQRGASGGFRLGRPAADITLADVVRAVDGPLAAVRGQPPESVEYTGPARALTRVWVATRAALRQVLEATTVADLASGTLPDHVERLTEDTEAWRRR